MPSGPDATSGSRRPRHPIGPEKMVEQGILSFGKKVTSEELPIAEAVAENACEDDAVAEVLFIVPKTGLYCMVPLGAPRTTAGPAAAKIAATMSRAAHSATRALRVEGPRDRSSQVISG